MTTTVHPLANDSAYDSAYWGLGGHSEGLLYIGLCSHIPGNSAGLFTFDPTTQQLWQRGDIGRVLGVAHGKIHTPIIEGEDDRMYFGTHFAYPYGDPSQEVTYEGGHLIAYDPANDTFTDYGVAAPGEGILTIALTASKAYLLTIPSGHLIEADLSSRGYRPIGTIPSKGSICRTIVTDSAGRVYGSFEDDGLFVYDPITDNLQLLPGFFPDPALAEWNASSRGGVNRIGRHLWRCVTYDAQRNCLYGIYASGHAFRIDCESLQLTMLGLMLPDTFNTERTYPTLSAAATATHLYYVPAQGCFDYCRSDNITGASHLMSLDKQTGAIRDHGPLTQGDSQVLGIAGAALHNGQLYLLGAVSSKKQPKPAHTLLTLNGQPFTLSLIRVTP